MKQLRTILLLFCIITNISNINAQLSKIVKSPLIIGIGANFVYNEYKLNTVPYPSQLTVEKFLTNGITIEGIVSYNDLSVRRRVNKEQVWTKESLLSLDANFNYHLNDFFEKYGWFDPYLLIGYGMTSDDGRWNHPTTNLGGGINAWVKKRIGIKVQGEAKWTLADAATNYLHFSVGLVYKLGGDKGEDANPAKKHLRSIIKK